jgi:branched-chain amino acid transport system permease protein
VSISSAFIHVTAALVFFVVMAALPRFADPFLVTVGSLVFMYAYLGIAWNLMFGFAGQLSIGHALFFGIGAYVAAILSDRYSINAWLSVAFGAAICSAVGALIAALGFRFSVRGVYFALLTVAAAEFVRIWFENWSFIGASGGYFMQVRGEQSSLITLRGDSDFFYNAFLSMAFIAFVIQYFLMRSRYGYYWRAIRDDEDTARAVGVPALRMKVLVVVISAAMTSVGGSMFAFFSGNLFPDTVLSMRFSIEIMIAPIIGGVTTLFGPFIGALFVVPAMEISNHLSQKTGLFGLNTFLYGLLIVLTVRFLPDGVWPPLARILFRIDQTRPTEEKPDTREETK